jgi:hypothetical protein
MMGGGDPCAGGGVHGVSSDVDGQTDGSPQRRPETEAPPSADEQRPPSTVFVAVLGNCQAMALACVMDSLPGVEARYFARRRQRASFRGQAARFQPIDDLARELRARRSSGQSAVLLEQVTPVRGSELGAEVLELLDRHLPFPHLELLCLWPTLLYSADRIETLGPRRLFRLDCASMDRVAARTPIDLRDFIQANWRSRILFESPRHPAPVLFAQLVNAVLSSTPDLCADEDRAAAVRDVAAESVFGGHAIYPAWAPATQMFQCAWSRSLTYRRWSVAVDAFARGQFAAARSLSEKVLSAPPQDAEFAAVVRIEALTLLSACNARLGRHGDARAAIDAAIDGMDVEGRILRRALCLRAGGDVESAIIELQRLTAEGWDNPFDRDLLMELLVGVGRYDEAAELAERDLAEGSRARARSRMGFVELARAAERMRAAASHFDAVQSSELEAEAKRFAGMSRAYADQLQDLVVADERKQYGPRPR